MIQDDTIAAIATALGEAALSVIRVSGPDALRLVDRCFVPAGRTGVKVSEAASHTLHFGHIVRDGSVVDEVMVSVMKAPRSFTREDVVEVTCHGGPLPARSVLGAILDAGARLAEPGEFTRRAFINGRIDLAQAEAVMDLIRSRTQLSMTAATEQLAGKLSRKVEAVRQELMRTLAHVEAYIDFPDEDIAPQTSDALAGSIRRGLGEVRRLLGTAQEGRVLRRGFRAAIIGRPNAGKSSLLNQLLGQERAIVSPIPGTTRDTIEEMANIHGIPVLFIDTAGLRDAGDEVEREGMRRAQESADRAELVLHVLDASEPLHPADRAYLAQLAGKKRIVVRNKADLPQKVSDVPAIDSPQVAVSCITGEGLDSLKLAIKEMAWSGEIRAEMLEVMINARHEAALNRGAAALERACESLSQGHPPELVAEDLRLAVAAIGEISGKTATEDLLDVIFSEFCIGK